MEGEKGPQIRRKGRAQEEAGALRQTACLTVGLEQWTSTWAQGQQHQLPLDPKLDKQILGLHHRPTESETLGWGREVCGNKPEGDCDASSSFRTTIWQSLSFVAGPAPK